MKALTAIAGGVAGACAVTLIHESVRRVVPQAPRMDLLGMNAISKSLRSVGAPTPGTSTLFTAALVGDLVANSIYYGLSGIGKDKNLWLRSSIMGLAAGIGAVVLPGPLGLEERHSNKTVSTKLMTVGLYVAGALATAAVMKLLERKKEKKNQVWERKLVTSAMG